VATSTLQYNLPDRWLKTQAQLESESACEAVAADADAEIDPDNPDREASKSLLGVTHR